MAVERPENRRTSMMIHSPENRQKRMTSTLLPTALAKSSEGALLTGQALRSVQELARFPRHRLRGMAPASANRS